VKLVYFSDGAGARRPGVLKHGEVFEIGADLLPERDSPQAMRALIDRFDSLRDRLESLPASATGRPVNQVTLHAPLPARNKVLACLGNTRPGLGEPSPVHLFLKGGTAVAGPGSTIDLANLGGREVFLADAVVGLVIKGPVHRVAASDWRKAVFGYVTLLDVAARLVGLIRWPPGSCVGATFDGFGPPCWSQRTRSMTRSPSASGNGTTTSCGRTIAWTTWSPSRRSWSKPRAW
jgi:2-keto-4-pentenoate hydratase/2-oxohepta-3-ene-1,7-dioic acid hydratase in catechol pathway